MLQLWLAKIDINDNVRNTNNQILFRPFEILRNSSRTRQVMKNASFFIHTE